MVCSKCGAVVDGRSKKCSFCGTPTHQTGKENTDPKLNENIIQPEPKNNLFKKYFGLFLGIGLLLIILIVVLISIFSGPKNERLEALMNIEQTKYLNFTIDGKKFKLGEKVSNYKKNNISFEDQYLTEDAYVESDSIAMYNFYDEEKTAQFLGAFYCAEKEKCKYDDSLLIKINFYDDSEVVVNDFIKYGIEYDEIVKKYGKEDGAFYQDEDLLVWTFGEKGKIGTPYYVLRFDNDSFLADGELIEIRMGIWWYEEEYKHTVKPISKEETSNEK